MVIGIEFDHLFSPDGTSLAEDHDETVQSVCFSPDGNKLPSDSEDQSIGSQDLKIR